VTRASLREYAAVQRERYRQATRAEKRQLLDEVVAVTGIHRKAAIRLLRRAPRPRATPGPGGRPRAYGPEVATVAEVLWQARIGAHRLHPFVPELLDRLLRCGELTLAPTVDKLVRQASRPTLARLLGPARAHYPLRGATITRPGLVLKHEIPIRTFTEWTDARPGFFEVDLVAHCGSKTDGFYLCTLCAVDIPVEKLVTKTRQGARTHRVYDRAQTPYQRLCATGVLAPATRRELDALYQSLNPLQLRRTLERELDRLWTLAAPDPHRVPGNTEIAPPSSRRLLETPRRCPR
jgi:hypothetical protein